MGFQYIRPLHPDPEPDLIEPAEQMVRGVIRQRRAGETHDSRRAAARERDLRARRSSLFALAWRNDQVVMVSLAQ